MVDSRGPRQVHALVASFKYRKTCSQLGPCVGGWAHPVWSKYSNSPSPRRLRLYHRLRFGLSSAPLSPILSVKRDGKV